MSQKREKIEYLDALFSTRFKYTREQLDERFQLKFKQSLKRIFFNYIQILKEEGAPLKTEYDKTKFGKTLYFYDEVFSLTKNPLKSEHLQKVKTALTILKQVEGLPQTDELTALIAMVESQTNLKTVDNQPIVLLDHRPSSDGIRWISKLYKWIEEKTVLELVYRPYPQDALDYERIQGKKVYFHPYFLKESQRYWYLFGLNQVTQTIPQIKSCNAQISSRGSLITDRDFHLIARWMMNANKRIEVTQGCCPTCIRYIGRSHWFISEG
jgi:hypothetical protein